VSLVKMCFGAVRSVLFNLLIKSHILAACVTISFLVMVFAMQNVTPSRFNTCIHCVVCIHIGRKSGGCTRI